ncbi:hypothetical protein [Thysanoplusia orichalcea nucleopolyhedrovirus]|uniref:Uncharacterized protein n=1 Tax=Thysanoplusia orichalcea nucleopolyhedrovirus TaxID=101850 RepID=L0CLS1_9ABAC|nr:hypothetical protein [Thysanoplusia orichalcea nucleopolyhedrovirus]AGA16268.1 hypothetical protein [Thysanoplusia orichalcea nucleopolyhedrovirus]
MHFSYWTTLEYLRTHEMAAVNAMIYAAIPCLMAFFIVEVLCKNSNAMYDIMHVILFTSLDVAEKCFNVAKTIAAKRPIRQTVSILNSANKFLMLCLKKYKSINYAVKVAAVYYNVYVLYYSLVFLHYLLFFNVHSKIIIKLFIVTIIDAALYFLIVK